MTFILIWESRKLTAAANDNSLECLSKFTAFMSFKFGISAVKGPTEVLAMSRISVEPDSTALHLAAVCLDCTSCEAQEKICRLEAFTS